VIRGALLIALAACSQAPPPSDAGTDAATSTCGVTLAQWPAADGIFQNDPSWIGSDAAYSVDLGNARVLWLFGDTFVAKDSTRSRSNAWFVRNSVGIQSGGYDPSAAKVAFSWKTNAGAASSFFPESGTNWFWPLGGVRLPTRLVLFLLEESQTGQGAFGFQAVGTKVVFVTNPDADPSSWNVVDGNLPAFAFPIAFGAAVAHDGAYVYAFGDEEPGDHSVYVARFDAGALDAGDASSPLFFANGAWVPPSASAPPAIFPSSGSLDNPPTEFSVQQRADGTWLAVHSIGFGATQIAVRTAPAPEGPWTTPCAAFTPPEASRSNVIEYAAKAHPELQTGTPDALVITYATNSTDLATLANDMTIYFPRFVRQ
jgi:hypothetical protein